MHFVFFFFTFEIFLVVQKWKADRFGCLFPRKMWAEPVCFAHSNEISSTSLCSHTVANKQLDFSLKCKRMYSQYTKLSKILVWNLWNCRVFLDGKFVIWFLFRELTWPVSFGRENWWFYNLALTCTTDTGITFTVSYNVCSTLTYL